MPVSAAGVFGAAGLLSTTTALAKYMTVRFSSVFFVRRFPVQISTDLCANFHSFRSHILRGGDTIKVAVRDGCVTGKIPVRPFLCL